MYPLDVNAKTDAGVALHYVYLPHPPQDAEKIATLRTDLLENGWRGRPVILADAGDHHIALTGCHRLAAAQGIDQVLRVVYLPGDLSCEDWEEIDSSYDDDDVLSALEGIAENRDDMAEIVEVMRAEVASNYA